MQKGSTAGGASRDSIRSMNTEIPHKHEGMVSGKPKLSWTSDLQGISKAITKASTNTAAVKGWARKMWVH